MSWNDIEDILKDEIKIKAKFYLPIYQEDGYEKQFAIVYKKNHCCPVYRTTMVFKTRIKFQPSNIQKYKWNKGRDVYNINSCYLINRIQKAQ